MTWHREVTAMITSLADANVRHQWPFYQHGLTLIPAWINNYIYHKMWDEITDQFLKFNGATVEV